MKALDFNALQQPTWDVKLKDGTLVHLTAPTVELIDKLMAAAPEFKELAANKDSRTIRAVYELLADLMNCNDDGFTFNADELMTKYKMTLYDVFKFTAGYFEFISELQDAKN